MRKKVGIELLKDKKIFEVLILKWVVNVWILGNAYFMAFISDDNFPWLLLCYL